uniref:Uncharacterized protein n=1 Tax=Rhizophora mucronata TaxID=61149 RepID=A0A2P2IV42_RHIMU
MKNLYNQISTSKS